MSWGDISRTAVEPSRVLSIHRVQEHRHHVVAPLLRCEDTRDTRYKKLYTGMDN